MNEPKKNHFSKRRNDLERVNDIKRLDFHSELCIKDSIYALYTPEVIKEDKL